MSSVNCANILIKPEEMVLRTSDLQAVGQKQGFPGSSAGKESACNVGDLGSIPNLRKSLGGWHGNPLLYCCLENSHGQRSLEGYNPWGHKESDQTE